MTSMTLQEFREKVSKLPKEKQAQIIESLFDMIYSGLDDKVFRVMATAIKYAKETGAEDHEKFQIPDSELEKLSHIQDKNRLIQNKK
ncbi:MAG: hypothetical protein U1F57_09480 [bacterium]